MTSKQRAALRALASVLDPVFQIGKGDITPNQLEGLEEVLNKRELIKISVLRNSPVSASEAAAIISEKLGAQTVEIKGSKIVLYRYSKDKNVKHLEF